MENLISNEEVIKQTTSNEGKQLMQQYLKARTPELANANDLVYKAYKRPYMDGSGTYVLIILANGWYYPTPQVNLYFESSGGNEYKLMQNNSNVGFYLVTYHNAEWTSGAGLLNMPNTITVEDAYGKHTVNVESF